MIGTESDCIFDADLEILNCTLPMEHRWNSHFICKWKLSVKSTKPGLSVLKSDLTQSKASLCWSLSWHSVACYSCHSWHFSHGNIMIWNCISISIHLYVHWLNIYHLTQCKPCGEKVLVNWAQSSSQHPVSGYSVNIFWMNKG